MRWIPSLGRSPIESNVKSSWNNHGPRPSATLRDDRQYLLFSGGRRRFRSSVWRRSSGGRSDRLQVDPDSEIDLRAFETRFDIDRAPGYYYIQLRVILFRKRNGKLFAQVESFFFGRRPFQIGTGHEDRLTLPVSWPREPLEALQHYGTVKPQRKRPWWRFW